MNLPVGRESGCEPDCDRIDPHPTIHYYRSIQFSRTVQICRSMLRCRTTTWSEDVEVSTPARLRAMADPLRSTLLDLLLERAATVSELAAAVRRPKSTVAHHVNVLVDAGLLRVVRTRRVRAIDERYYGRTARLFRVGVDQQDRRRARGHVRQRPVGGGGRSRPRARGRRPAHASFATSGSRRERAREFWEQVLALAQEFAAATPRRRHGVRIRRRSLPDRPPDPARTHAGLDPIAGQPVESLALADQAHCAS